jgi:hypothetical protein
VHVITLDDVPKPARQYVADRNRMSLFGMPEPPSDASSVSWAFAALWTLAMSLVAIACSI